MQLYTPVPRWSLHRSLGIWRKTFSTVRPHHHACFVAAEEDFSIVSCPISTTFTSSSTNISRQTQVRQKKIAIINDCLLLCDRRMLLECVLCVACIRARSVRQAIDGSTPNLNWQFLILLIQRLLLHFVVLQAIDCSIDGSDNTVGNHVAHSMLQ